MPTAIHRALGVAPTLVEQPELAVAEGAVRAASRPVPVSAGGFAVVTRTDVPHPDERGSDEPSWPPVAQVPAVPPVQADLRRPRWMRFGAVAAAVRLVAALGLGLVLERVS